MVSNTSVKEARGIILSLSTFLKATDKPLKAITNTNKVGKDGIKLTRLYHTNASQPKTESYLLAPVLLDKKADTIPEPFAES